jgi:hypothetical protein
MSSLYTKPRGATWSAGYRISSGCILDRCDECDDTECKCQCHEGPGKVLAGQGKWNRGAGL